MKAIDFEEANIIYAKDQPEYLPLPAHKTNDSYGAATFCFELDEEEKKQLLETGKLWISVVTFNKPLQPIRMSVLKPEFEIQPETPKTES